MAVDRGATIAWSAGVSAAAAGMAALFADGRTLFDRVVFGTFSIIGTVTFLILACTAIPASWLHLPGRRHKGETRSGSASSSDSQETGALLQANVARDGGSVFAAQGGDVIVHQAGPGQQPPPPTPPGDHPGRVP